MVGGIHPLFRELGQLHKEPGDAVTALTRKSSVLEVTAQTQHF